MELALKIVAPKDREEYIIPLGVDGYSIKDMKGAETSSCELALSIKKFFQLFKDKEQPTKEEIAGHTRNIRLSMGEMLTPKLTYKYIQEAEENHPQYIKESIKQLGGACPDSLFEAYNIGIYAILYANEGNITVPLIDSFNYYVVTNTGSTFAKL